MRELGIIGVFPIVLLLSVCPFPFPARAAEATEVVAKLQATLQESMKNSERLGFQGRYQKLKPVVIDTHDLPFVTRLVLGRYWTTLTDEQKELFLNVFRRLSIASYAGRFDRYKGQRFEVGTEKALSRGQGRMVEGELIKPDGEIVRFTYLLHRVAGDWRIVNIIVNGVSDLALKRAEYDTILDKEGFSRLIEMMEEQIRGYAEGQ